MGGEQANRGARALQDAGWPGRWLGLRAGVVLFSAVLIVALWAGAAWLLQRDRSIAIDNIVRANGQLVRVFEEHAVRSFAEAAQLAAVIRSQYLRQGKAFDLVQFFRDAQGDRKLVQNALIADASGRMVLSSLHGAPVVNIADREHFRVHVARDTGRIHIGKPVQTRSANQWSFVVSLRINLPDGSFGGTVGIALDPAYFAQLYAQTDFGEGGAVNLIGLDGIVRARAASGRSETAGQDISGGEIFRQIAQRPAGSYTAPAKVDGVRRLQTYRQIAGYPLVIAVGVSEKVALAEVEAHRNIYFLVSLLLTALIGAATLLFYASVSRQQRTTAALAAASKRLLDAQELAGMISLEWTIDGDHVAWSRPPEVLLGPAPAGGHPVYRDLVHADDRDTWLAERALALTATGPTRYSDYRLIRTDGESRWISCTQRPAEMVNGVRRATFTLLDITERKAAEFALARSEARLRDLTHTLEAQVEARTGEIRAREALLRMVTENIPVMIAYFDAGFHLRFANADLARHLGIDPGQSTAGLHAAALFPPERQRLLKPHVDAALAGTMQRFEVPHRHAAGHTTELTLVPDRQADGSVAGIFMAMIDVTDRKRTEHALQTSVSLLSATLEATADGILVVGGDKRISRFNQRFLDMWRIPADIIASRDDDRALGFVLEQLVDPAGFVAKVEELYATPLTESYDTLSFKDGRTFERYSCPQLVDGVAAGRVWSFRDVTARRQAEAALRAAHERYTAIVSNMVEGVIVRDRHGVIIDCNTSAERMFGVSREQMRGKPSPPCGWAAFREDGTPVPDLRRASHAALASGQLQSNIVTAYHKPDGSVVWHSSNSQPLLDGNDPLPVGVFTTYTDITARKQAEQSLRAADARYRAMVTNMTEGVVVRDGEGRIVDCNPSAELILGRSSAEIVGSQDMAGAWEVTGEDGSPVPQQERSAHKALHSGKLQPAQVLGFHKPDGSTLWLSMISKPALDPATGKVTDVFTTFVDVTGQRQEAAVRDALEAQLRESQKMEAMGTLAGGIAHDFNNILGAILGNVALARDDAGNNPAVQQSLDEISKAGARAKQLVQQILAFSRKQPQQFAEVEVQRVVDETLALLRATLPAGIRIDATPAAIPCRVLADATQLGQVLMNLCTNAWHAVSDAGRAGAAGAIAVRLDRVELGSSDALRFGAVPPGAWVRLTVSDSGNGMDAATQARMFEPFFTTRQVGEGTGLGLSVAHGIVRAHHGAIAVNSTAGKGTVFEVILPALESADSGTTPAAGTVPAASAGAVATGRPATAHVLYVDDEAAMVFLVKRMLTKLGYRVSAFERPADALAALRADPAGFDVVVTDFNMPGHSGLDVAREAGLIRRELPVVIASGYITDELRAGATQLGVHDLIYKPNTVEELCQAIARALP